MRWSLWDLPGILSALGWIIGLAVRGVIQLEVAAFFLVCIVVVKALGRGLGGSIGRAVRLGFNVGLPVVSLITLAILLTGGDLNDVTKVVVGSLALLIMLYGIDVMISGAFVSKKRR